MITARCLLFVLAFPAGADAACNARAEDRPGDYRKAYERVMRLQEFRNWSKGLTRAVPIAFGEMVDRQQLLEDLCYWTVTVYTDEGSHFSRWTTFFVPVTYGAVLVEDRASGEPVPLIMLPR